VSLAVLVTSAVLFGLGMVLLKLAERRRLHRELVCYRVRFPRHLDAKSVAEFFAGLSGLLLPWWRRAVVTPFVICETSASSAGVEHRVLVPESWASMVENLLQAHVPGARYERIDVPALPARVGAEYRLSTGLRVLRMDATAMSARILSAVQPLRGDEQVVVQWTLTPAAPVTPARLASAGEPRRLWRDPSVRERSDEVAALREKQAQPLLLGVARIGVLAAPSRARRLLHGAEAPWAAARAPGVHLRRRSLVGRAASAGRLIDRRVPLAVWPGLFNAEELAGLVGWPIGVEQLPGLLLGGRALPPSPQIVGRGTVIGEATFPGSERPIALDVQARLRAWHVLGPTGTGKSTLLCNATLQDLEAGHGVFVIDFKGDLITDLLARMPASRRDDVVVLDPADPQPAGFNPLLVTDGTTADVVVDNITGIFRSIWGRSAVGARSEDLIRNSARTLALSGDFTLAEVAALWNDPTFRRRLVGKLDDPALEEFWGWFSGLSAAEVTNITAAPANKLRAFVGRPQVRGIIGQAKPEWSISDVLANRGVLLVSLASGLIGSEASALLGSLLFASIWNATLARVRLPAEARPPVFGVIDEFQNVVKTNTPMAEILAASRGLGVGLTVAHQALTQLDRPLVEQVLANCRSRTAFQLNSQDARVLAREFGAGLTPEDLQALDAYEAVTQVFAAGHTQPPVTIRTLPATAPTADPNVLRAASRERFGVDRADVESAIRTRLQRGAPDAPIGRRRRSDADRRAS
jgi:hypothetical protein